MSEEEEICKWDGIWQFTKEKKIDLKFNYKRLSDSVPRDLLNYVSFLPIDNFEEKERGRGRGSFTNTTVSRGRERSLVTGVETSSINSKTQMICLHDGVQDVEHIEPLLLPHEGTSHILTSESSTTVERHLTGSNQTSGDIGTGTSDLNAVPVPAPVHSKSEPPFSLHEIYPCEEVREEEVPICRTHRFFGLWHGSFEVSVAAEVDAGKQDGQQQQHEVFETFFFYEALPGPAADGAESGPEGQASSALLADLPPLPRFSCSFLRRAPHVAQALRHLPYYSDFLLALEPAERERLQPRPGTALMGLGRNKFGRFSLAAFVEDNSGSILCEKKYLLSKHGNAHIKPRRRSGPGEVQRKPSRPSGGWDDEPGDGRPAKRRRGSRSKGGSQGEPRACSGDEDGLAPCAAEAVATDLFRPAALDEESGEIYEGQWLNGRRHGHGVCVYADGTMYEGGWRLGAEHGRGALMTGDRTPIYSGDWADGLPHGQGVYRWACGDSYSGDWREGVRHGRGAYLTSGGCCYSGDWKDGRRHGKGLFSWPDGGSYEGDWEADQRHGRQGVLVLPGALRYDGPWAGNSMEGRGSCEFPDGQQYQGSYRLGVREGRGSLTFPEGAVYEGRFRDDRMDGQGTLKLLRPVQGLGDEVLVPITLQTDIRKIHVQAGFCDTAH